MRGVIGSRYGVDERHRVFQANSPCLRTSVRNSRRRASFMFKTWTVARPVALTPLMRTPSNTEGRTIDHAADEKGTLLAPSEGRYRQIRAFVQIAAVARQREIIGIVRAPVLLRRDVFNMMLKAGLFLVQTAIFATPAGPQPDEVPRRRSRTR